MDLDPRVGLPAAAPSPQTAPGHETSQGSAGGAGVFVFGATPPQPQPQQPASGSSSFSRSPAAAGQESSQGSGAGVFVFGGATPPQPQQQPQPHPQPQPCAGPGGFGAPSSAHAAGQGMPGASGASVFVFGATPPPQPQPGIATPAGGKCQERRRPTRAPTNRRARPRSTATESLHPVKSANLQHKDAAESRHTDRRNEKSCDDPLHKARTAQVKADVQRDQSTDEHGGRSSLPKRRVFKTRSNRRGTSPSRVDEAASRPWCSTTTYADGASHKSSANRDATDCSSSIHDDIDSAAEKLVSPLPAATAMQCVAPSCCHTHCACRLSSKGMH